MTVTRREGWWSKLPFNHLLVLACTITLHSTLEVDFTGQNQSTVTSVPQQRVENTTRDGREVLVIESHTIRMIDEGLNDEFGSRKQTDEM